MCAENLKLRNRIFENKMAPHRSFLDDLKPTTPQDNKQFIISWPIVCRISCLLISLNIIVFPKSFVDSSLLRNT